MQEATVAYWNCNLGGWLNGYWCDRWIMALLGCLTVVPYLLDVCLDVLRKYGVAWRTQKVAPSISDDIGMELSPQYI